MPTYEYRCNKCMAHTVLSRKVEERDEEVTCVCGHTSSRIYNTPAIRFNGSGFYSTGGQIMCNICKGGGCSVCFKTEGEGLQFASGKEIEEFFDSYSEVMHVDPAESTPEGE